jgi:hypothetical protein
MDSSMYHTNLNDYNLNTQFYYNEYLPFINYKATGPTWMTGLVNKRIHLKNTRGMFKVLRVTKNKLYITCNKWDQGKWVHNSDFKCLSGGINNIHHPAG